MRFLCRVPQKRISVTRRPISCIGGDHHRVDNITLGRQQQQQLEKELQPQRKQAMLAPGSSSNPCSSRVKHDSIGNKFTLDLGNNKMACIEYRPIGRNRIEMYHTEVPEELRGQGIGRRLAMGALELLAAEGSANRVEPKRVKLTCSYLICQLDKFADERLKKLIVGGL